MSTRSTTSLLALLVGAGVLAAPAQAQQSQETFLPWLGCWQATGAEPGAPMGDGMPVLCIREHADGEGIVVATLVGGTVAAERELRADGELIPVDEGGCAGWESVAWSGDGHRLYLSGEALCEGNQTRATSGLMAFVSPTEWVEIEAVDAGIDHVPVRARSYRQVTPPANAPAGVLPGIEGRNLAVETARAVASRPLGLSEVEEAARFVMPQVVQAALVEGTVDMAVDAATLERLADAGVDADILDVMVALANPSVFSLSVEAGAERVPSAPSTGSYFRDRWSYSGLCSNHDAYGRYLGYGSPFGGLDPFMSYRSNAYCGGYQYGYGYGYDSFGRTYGRRGSGPIVIIEIPSDYEGTPANRRLKAVKGQGYADRGRTSNGSTGRSSTVTSSRPATTGTSSSGSSGTTTTTRKAKPRGGGGGGI